MNLKTFYSNLYIPGFVFIVIVFFSSCNNNIKNDKPKADLEVTTTFGGSYYHDTSETIFVVGKLKNLSADTISFYSMTCSWDDAWFITSKNMEIEKNICFQNGPVLIKLGPKESMLNYLKIRLLKSYQELSDEKFQVGFNLIKANTVDVSKQIVLDSPKNIFWADTLALNKLYRFNTITKEE